MERDTPVVENGPIEGASNSQGTQQSLPEENNCSQLEDDRLIARARAVDVDYEFAKPGVVKTEDERKKKAAKPRRISEQEKRLREVVGDLPPPPPAGSSQQEDKAYSAIRAFEVEQMTYAFSFCGVCKERRLECKGLRNICTRCRRDKKVPKVWSGENNMDPMAVPEILSDMSDAEQMLIARLAPTVHVHLLKYGGIASKGHCIAFPQALHSSTTTGRGGYHSREKTRKR